MPLGMHPLFGVLNGSVTLTGGPATGLAFAPAFEQAGVPGAATVAVAAAMVGIVSGGLIGGPVGTILIERYGLRRRKGECPARSADRGADRRGSPARAAGVDAAGRGQGIVRAAQGAGRDPDRDVGRVERQRVVHLGRRDAARLHRRDARRGGHPQPRRCDRHDRAVAADDRRSRQRRAVAVPGARADDACGSGSWPGSRCRWSRF